MKYDKQTGKLKEKTPALLGPAIDLVFDVRQERLRLKKVVDGLEEEEKRLKDELMLRHKKQELNGAKGKRGAMKIEHVFVPKMEDWEKFYSYLRKTGEFDLMQRRLSNEAVEARWEANKVIPGVGRFGVVKVSVGKA